MEVEGRIVVCPCLRVSVHGDTGHSESRIRTRGGPRRAHAERTIGPPWRILASQHRGRGNPGRSRSSRRPWLSALPNPEIPRHLPATVASNAACSKFADHGPARRAPASAAFRSGFSAASLSRSTDSRRL